MLNKNLFKKAKNNLDVTVFNQQSKPNIPDEMCTMCPSCKKMIFVSIIIALSSQVGIGLISSDFRISAGIMFFMIFLFGHLFLFSHVFMWPGMMWI